MAYHYMFYIFVCFLIYTVVYIFYIHRFGEYYAARLDSTIDQNLKMLAEESLGEILSSTVTNVSVFFHIINELITRQTFIITNILNSEFSDLEHQVDWMSAVTYSQAEVLLKQDEFRIKKQDKNYSFIKDHNVDIIYHANFNDLT